MPSCASPQERNTYGRECHQNDTGSEPDRRVGVARGGISNGPRTLGHRQSKNQRAGDTPTSGQATENDAVCQERYGHGRGIDSCPTDRKEKNRRPDYRGFEQTASDLPGHTPYVSHRRNMSHDAWPSDPRVQHAGPVRLSLGQPVESLFPQTPDLLDNATFSASEVARALDTAAQGVDMAPRNFFKPASWGLRIKSSGEPCSTNAPPSM